MYNFRVFCFFFCLFSERSLAGHMAEIEDYFVISSNKSEKSCREEMGLTSSPSHTIILNLRQFGRARSNIQMPNNRMCINDCLSIGCKTNQLSRTQFSSATHAKLL